MESLQDRLIILLRVYRTIRFCDACLAMKFGAFPGDVLRSRGLDRGGISNFFWTVLRMSPRKDCRLRHCRLTYFMAVSLWKRPRQSA